MRDKIKKLLPSWFLTLLKGIRYVIISCLFHIFRLFPIDKKLVVVCNVWGFGDNAKYVAKELSRRKQGKNKDLKIVFICNHNKNEKPRNPNILMYKTNSLKAIYALSTARVWVDNNRKEKYISKRKGQYYIQTWHGGIALKKIEKDYKALPESYIRNAKRDSKMTDLYISNSNFCTDMYRSSFWFNGEILECGSPRNDILFNCSEEEKARIRRKLGIKNEKLAIYAPTYRESKDPSIYQLDYKKMVAALEERYQDKFVLAVRLHPLVSSMSTELEYSNNIINASSYGDLYELMAISDVMITDYSNIMFEFSFLKKPVFLYAKDMMEYERERGFYFDYKSIPYDKAETETELLSCIRNFQWDEYQLRVNEFLSELDIYETGYASKTVVDKIIEKLDRNTR